MFSQRMADMLLMKAPEQTCAFYRNGLLFVFNWHFGNSLNNVLIPVKNPGEYTVVLSSDDPKYGGFGNVQMQTYSSKVFNGQHFIELYIPARTCFVLKEKVILPPPEVKEEPKAEQPKAPRKRAAKKVTEEAAPVEEAPKKTTRKRATKKAEE